MAANRKAGRAKARKSKTRKKAVRRSAPKATPSAQVAPQAEQPVEQAQVAQTYPCNVLVMKGADKVPVTVTTEAQHKKLVEEFGAEHVQVQS